MLNPGSGAGRRDGADLRLRALLSEFRTGTATFRALQRQQAADIRNWGRGRFAAFVIDGLDLDLERTALANVAWCATHANQYPRRMLEACYSRFTVRLLTHLNPDVVILSGVATHTFESRIKKELPATLTIKTLHFAHRLGRVAEVQEIARVRAALRELGLQRR